jgi:hypothetical protein
MCVYSEASALEQRKKSSERRKQTIRESVDLDRSLFDNNVILPEDGIVRSFH